mmetsp:Transcript_147175/g.256901  ORF Transcript_147175/g.256901 Transcript_147175/m.256901 type:complete len:156 (-) Transcript_147175:120-587(-)
MSLAMLTRRAIQAATHPMLGTTSCRVQPGMTACWRRCLVASPHAKMSALDAFRDMKFKLVEADRLSRKGDSGEAWSMYEEARKWADSMNVMAQVPDPESQSLRSRRFITLMPPVGCDSSKEYLQVAIEAALLRAEEASSASSLHGSLNQTGGLQF